MPELGGWFCPVRAFKSWQDGGKGRQTGNMPMFVWRDNTGEVNAILGIVLEGKEPLITMRGFSPALPSILARQGTTKDM